MDQTIYRPYFYIIQHIESGKYYAGSKYGKTANPDNLLKSNGYKTSSKVIKNIILEEGLESFIIRKIRLFKTGEEALEYETKFLRRVNAAFNDSFFNRCNNAINALNKDFEKHKQTCLERFGYESSSSSPIVKEKKKQTSLERFGYESASSSPIVKEKTKQTCLERFGYESSSSSPIVKEKKQQTSLEKYGHKHPMQSPMCLELRKQTCLERFGYESSNSSPIVKEKKKQTSLERFGYESASSSPIVKEKTKQTCLERFGYESSNSSPIVKEKKQQTSLERCGYEHHSQVPETKEKQRKIINDLLNQPTISEIRNYRDRFKLKLGSNWYYKPQEILDGILAELKLSYGEISENI